MKLNKKCEKCGENASNRHEINGKPIYLCDKHNKEFVKEYDKE